MILIGPVGAVSRTLKETSPEGVVKKTIAENCIGITFFINDPIVSYCTFKNLATAAKNNDLLVGCSTNAYFTENTLEELIPYLDFVNIGLKGYSDRMYKSCGVQSSKPVLRNLKKEYLKYVYLSNSPGQII
jgi:pyruvate-formate lyase-activating enzyme